jgi:hypothetical protein
VELACPPTAPLCAAAATTPAVENAIARSIPYPNRIFITGLQKTHQLQLQGCRTVYVRGAGNSFMNIQTGSPDQFATGIWFLKMCRAR